MEKIALLFIALSLHAQVVTGRVTNALDGRPVKRASIALQGPTEKYLCQTDSEGRFSVGGMVSGSYEGTASRVGFQDAHFGVEGSLEIRLQPLAIVTGRIVDEAGEPVVQATVWAMRYQFITGRRELRHIFGASTNDRGEYRIAELPAGRWYLRVRKVEFRAGGQDRGPVRDLPYATTYYPGTPDPARAAGLALAPGALMEHLDMVMPRQQVYSIRVKTPPDTSAQIVSPSASLFFAKSGDVEFPGMVPGDYAVHVYPNKNGRADATPFATQHVQVADQDVALDLTRPTAIDVSGTAKGASTIVLRTEEGGAYVQSTQAVNADGSFRFKLEPNSYTVDIIGPAGSYLQAMKAGDRERPDHRFDPSRDSSPLTLVLASERGTVSGVTDGKRAMVTLIPDQSLPFWLDLYRTLRTDAAGAFRFADVVPGRYQLFAWRETDPEAPMDSEYRKPYEAQGVAVSVEPGGSLSVKLQTIDR